jgi:hypothetical protein
LIHADMLIMMSSYPFHTLYFLTTEAGRDIVYSLFEHFWTIWHRDKETRGIFSHLSLCSANLKSVTSRFVETLEWWWAGWKFRMEERGMVPQYHLGLTLTGKGNGLSQLIPGEKNIYWPFGTEAEAFEFLDEEFGAKSRTSNLRTSLTADTPSTIAKSLSTNVMQAYIAQRKSKYRTKIEPVRIPDGLHISSIRHLLRYLNTVDSAWDLGTFTTDYYSAHLPFAYIYDEDEERMEWLTLAVGVGSIGATLYTQVRCGSREIIGVAIGMIYNSPHVVVVVPGGGVYLCLDDEDETLELESIPYTFARVYRGIQDIGLKVEFTEYEEVERVTLVPLY